MLELKIPPHKTKNNDHSFRIEKGGRFHIFVCVQTVKIL